MKKECVSQPVANDAEMIEYVQHADQPMTRRC
jgi:hypothetical protein